MPGVVPPSVTKERVTAAMEATVAALQRAGDELTALEAKEKEASRRVRKGYGNLYKGARGEPKP